MKHGLALMTLGAWTAGGTAHAAEAVALARAGLWSDSLENHDVVLAKTPRVPLYGATLGARLPFLSNLTGTATAMYGTSDDEGGDRSKRLSGEFTLTGNTNQQFGFAVGYRFERARDEAQGSNDFIETELHSLRAGIVGSSPIFNDERHRVTTAFYVAGGIQNADSSAAGMSGGDKVFAGPEVIVAYTMTARERYVLDVRYRAAFYATDFERSARSQTQSAVFVSLGRRFSY